VNDLGAPEDDVDLVDQLRTDDRITLPVGQWPPKEPHARLDRDRSSEPSDVAGLAFVLGRRGTWWRWRCGCCLVIAGPRRPAVVDLVAHHRRRCRIVPAAPRGRNAGRRSELDRGT
jgi:hypothetical protein